MYQVEVHHIRVPERNFRSFNLYPRGKYHQIYITLECNDGGQPSAILILFGWGFHFLIILPSKNNQIELRYQTNIETYYIFNSQELHYCSPNCLRQLMGQSVALSLFCAITVIQEHNVGATIDRRKFLTCACKQQA